MMPKRRSIDHIHSFLVENKNGSIHNRYQGWNWEDVIISSKSSVVIAVVMDTEGIMELRFSLLAFALLDGPHFLKITKIMIR